MSTQKNQSFRRRLGFALAGLAHALKAERSLRAQAAVFVLVVAALTALRPGALWWAAVMLSSAGVLAAELFNTALEALVDHLHPEQHPRVRIVKDYEDFGDAPDSYHTLDENGIGARHAVTFSPAQLINGNRAEFDFGRT